MASPEKPGGQKSAGRTSRERLLSDDPQERNAAMVEQLKDANIDPLDIDPKDLPGATDGLPDAWKSAHIDPLDIPPQKAKKETPYAKTNDEFLKEIGPEPEAKPEPEYAKTNQQFLNEIGPTTEYAKTNEEFLNELGPERQAPTAPEAKYAETNQQFLNEIGPTSEYAKTNEEFLKEISPRERAAVEAVGARGAALEQEAKKAGFMEGFRKLGEWWSKQNKWVRIAAGVGLVAGAALIGGPVGSALGIGAMAGRGILTSAATFYTTEKFLRNSKAKQERWWNKYPTGTAATFGILVGFGASHLLAGLDGSDEAIKAAKDAAEGTATGPDALYHANIHPSDAEAVTKAIEGTPGSLEPTHAAIHPSDAAAVEAATKAGELYHANIHPSDAEAITAAREAAAAPQSGMVHPSEPGVMESAQAQGSAATTGPEVIDKSAATPEAVDYPAHEVVSGDRTWKLIENHPALAETLRGLTEEQKTYVIDGLKDNLQSLRPDELKALGFSSGNIEVLRVGDKLDLGVLFDQPVDREYISSLREQALGLNPEQLEDIKNYTPPTEASSASPEAGQIESVEPTMTPEQVDAVMNAKLDELFSTNGIFGFGAQSGIESSLWQSLHNLPATEVMNETDEQYPGIDKLKDYLFEINDKIGNYNQGETVEQYIRRGIEAGPIS